MAPTRALPLGLALLGLSLSSAGCLNHFLIHRRQPPPGVDTWSEESRLGELRVRTQWARPAGSGPFPAVIVHPEAGKSARKMRGILHSLASEGYLAVAADYERDGNDLFPWRSPEDVTLVFDQLAAHPSADPDRIGAIGFSQGGVYSLLIAARRPEVRAVVAYYPVTDFQAWLDRHRRGGHRLAFKLIRRYFYKKSGARTEAEFREKLHRASPMHHAESIRAPVLLIHGRRDTSAPLAESERLEQRLEELDRDVELIVVEGASHVFNFKHEARARRAWQSTLTWLDRHLKDVSPP